MLDELKLGLLAGTLDQGTMLRPKAVAADLHDASGDDRLDAVLAEIDLRVAVELAKSRHFLNAADYPNFSGICAPQCQPGWPLRRIAAGFQRPPPLKAQSLYDPCCHCHGAWI